MLGQRFIVVSPVTNRSRTRAPLCSEVTLTRNLKRLSRATDVTRSGRRRNAIKRSLTARPPPDIASGAGRLQALSLLLRYALRRPVFTARHLDGAQELSFLAQRNLRRLGDPSKLVWKEAH